MWLKLKQVLTVVGALLRAALVASCLRGAFPPVDLRAVCLVRAMIGFCRCLSVDESLRLPKNGPH